MMPRLPICLMIWIKKHTHVGAVKKFGRLVQMTARPRKFILPQNWKFAGVIQYQIIHQTRGQSVNHTNQMEQMRYEIDAELERIIMDNITKAGKAKDIAQAIISDFKRTCGGLLWYIPKTDQADKIKRNKEIRERYTGDNIHELSREYNLTHASIYKIIKQGK